MILTNFIQRDIEIPIAVFETEEERKEFLRLIPGYQSLEETLEDFIYEYEMIDHKALPEYLEIKYKGNSFPITKFMFPFEDPIDIYSREVPNMSKANQSLVAGETKVDAYVLPNLDVEEYIKNREKGYRDVAKVLKKSSYIPIRDFAGSEDGEAVLYRKKGEKETRVLTYLDPRFVDSIKKLNEEEIEKWVLSLIK